MYGDFVLTDRPGQQVHRAPRLPLGDTNGRNEAWLRDLLFDHPEAIPIVDIDPSFGPLLPLCRELRTAAGPLDLAFINGDGKLTLVECKLWRNPEARRKVVAQVLDYAATIARWTYSDLQRQVSIASGTKENVPFAKAFAHDPLLQERHFADAVTRNMRAGRFLLLIAGDGIREDVGALTELINTNAAAGFAFGLVEIALYDMGGGSLAIRPRVVAKTHVIERNFVVVRDRRESLLLEEEDEEARRPRAMGLPATREGADASAPEGESPKQAEYRRWWQPVLAMTFDDPDQEPPRLYWQNHVRVQLPWPATWITAYGTKNGYGVNLGGSSTEFAALWLELTPMLDEIAAELPEGTEVSDGHGFDRMTIHTIRASRSFAVDDEARDWLKTTLNAYVNVLRPRIKQFVA